MGSVKLPQVQLSEIQQPRGRKSQADLIMDVLGNNPLAQGINQVAPEITDALAKRALARKQAQQVAQLATANGESLPPDNSLTPDLYDKSITIRNDRAAKKSTAAAARVDRELALEKLRSSYTETDPATGKVKTYPGVQGLNIEYDPEGNPFIKRDTSYVPKQLPKSGSSGGLQNGSIIPLGTAADGTPLAVNNKSGNVIKLSVPGGGSVFPKNQPAVAQKDVKDIDDQLQQLSDLRGLLKSVPGGIQGGAESLASKLTLGAVGSEAKQYNDMKPAIATKIYRATTGDTRLSDADASARAYPLLPSLGEPENVRESKLANIENILKNRKSNLLTNGGLKQIPQKDSGNSLVQKLIAKHK